MLSKEDFFKITSNYFNDNLSEKEERIFFDYLKKPAYQVLLEQFIDDKLKEDVTAYTAIQESRLVEIEQAILNYPVRHTSWISWKKYAVAAVLLFVFAFAGYLFVQKKQAEGLHTDLISLNGPDIPSPNRDYAYVTLADGREVPLNNTNNDLVVIDSQMTIHRDKDGELSYHLTEGIKKPVQMNTLTNPKGSKVVNLKLADGTQVWLNAGSSISYPIPFDPSKREVVVEGEVYFEVAHRKNYPFIVKSEQMKVEVLGTKFNFNAYKGEQVNAIALLEGSVKVSKPASETNAAILKPGEWAKLGKSDDKLIVEAAPMDQVLAWKEGRFDFENLPFETAMKQIERWYNIDVKYKSIKPKLVFSGDLDRNTSLKGIIQLLDLLGIKAHLEERTLYIE